MSPLAQLLCLCTSVAFAPVPQMSQEAWGIMRYTHEELSRGRHLLRISTTDLILDTQAWQRGRLHAFARDFADRTCPGRYVFLDKDRLTQYAGQFVFVCR